VPRRKLALALAATAAVMAPSAAQASSTQTTIFEAPRELLSGDAATRSQTLDEIQALGADWVRVLVYWQSVAPSPQAKTKPAFDERDPAAYDWSRLDGAIADARARGLGVLATITGPVPTWATGRREGNTFKPSPTRFERFTTAVARRYGGQVNAWSIWNEPNHPQFLSPQFRNGKPYSPTLYRSLYRSAVKGLAAAGRGKDTLLAGETAPRGTPRVVAPVDFVEGFWRGSSKGLRVSGWAHHPYTTSQGPSFVPPDRDDVTIGALSRLTRALDRATRNGIPLWLTEFGIQSEPDPFSGVSESRQAEYRSIAERTAFTNGRVKAFSQYLMRDDLPRDGRPSARYSGFESGLRHSDGRAKLAYDAFRLPLVVRRTSRSKISLWGIARPASGATTVVVEYRPRGSSAWRRLKADATNTRGAWSTTSSYRSGRTYRVTWNGQAGPPTRVYSR